MSKSLRAPSILKSTKPFRRRSICECNIQPSTKAFSSTFTRQDETELYGNRGRELREGPRWVSTPPRMMAPVRSKPPVPDNDFVVNKDSEKLDRVYNKVLGRGGNSMLTDEVKWLAVTHKSFDHGRRGYNDRLSYLGRRITDLQTSLALIHGASATEVPQAQDQYGREPFQHPALQGLNGLTDYTKATMTAKKRMAGLAESYGMDGVVRWKPKRMTNLEGSGLSIVLTQALYAIVGAVALQKGGKVANEVARERILKPLGL